MTEIPIRPGTITLLQVLKLAGVAENGGDAQGLVMAGHVKINGQLETRKRRQLTSGDEIQIRAPGLRVHLRLVDQDDSE
ncbi:MAG: RNA-binding S4 domain-containing protein [Planctomycetota bacterium]|nr:RNA-binding S4 domain-containing protein [Planctomycetota bacterium]RLT13163.1 MAG: RNA-binding S4 domain-containing protein [Planctomycetota bacterium]